MNVILYSDTNLSLLEPFIKVDLPKNVKREMWTYKEVVQKGFGNSTLFSEDEVKYLTTRNRYKVIYADEGVKDKDFKYKVEYEETFHPTILVDEYSTDEAIVEPKILSRYFPITDCP